MRNKFKYIASMATVDDPSTPIVVRGCTGINTFNHETEIQDDQCTVLTNSVLDTIGVIKKRLGYNTVLNDPGGAAVVALQHFNAPNVDERMIQIQGTNIYNSTDPLATSGSWGDLGAYVTANQYSTSMIVADDRTYITNGLDKVCYHNGAGIIQESDENADPPFCKVGCYFKNRLWLANGLARGTATGDIATYTATSGDKLKVTIDGTAYDNIVMTGDNSIADAVVSINAAISAKGVAWADSTGYLRISTLSVGIGSTVAIADGTTGNGGECEDLFSGATVSVTGSSNPEWAWFSNSLATETFNRTTNVFKVQSGDATEIMSIIPAGAFAPNSILIFKETSIHELAVAGATSTYWNLTPIETRYGCVSYNCALENAGVIYYMSYSGIRTLRGEFAEIPMTKLIDTTWKTINWDYITRSRMIIWDNKLLVSVPTGAATSPNKVLCYDLLTKGWNIWDMNVGCWGIYLEHTPASTSAFEEVLMFGNAADGLVYHLFKSTQFNDIAAAINWDIQTKAYDFGYPDFYKAGGNFAVRFVTDIHASDTAMTVSYNKDGGGWVTLGTTKTSIKYPIDSLGQFKKIKFRLQQNATNTSQPVINGWTVDSFVTPARD